MALWQWKIEIDDNIPANFVLDPMAYDFTLKLKTNNESELNVLLNDINNNLDTKIVNGNEIRVYGDYDATPVTKQFTGTILTRNKFTTPTDSYSISAKDFFKDRIQTRAINKKYVDQEIGTTFKDMVDNQIGGGFTSTEVETIGISQPYNFIKEQAEHAMNRITASSFTEYYMKANKSVIFRSRQVSDSGLTITDTNILNLAAVAVKKSILESFGIIEVVGGNDTGGNRIIARRIVPNADVKFKDRVFPKIDERFTTYKGAKQHAISLANSFGKEFSVLPPLDVKDLASLPIPGQLITVNSTRLGISSIKFIVEEIDIHGRAGAAGTPFITLVLGDSEQTERDKLVLLKEIFEDEKRKALDIDAITSQKTVSGTDEQSVIDAPTLVKCSDFYLDTAPGGVGNCTFALDKVKQSELDV